VQGAGRGDSADVAAHCSGGRRPSSWIRRRRAQLRAEHASDPSARLHDHAASDALPGARPADTTPSGPAVAITQRQEAAATAEVRQRTDPLHYASSDGDHCRGPDRNAQPDADVMTQEVDNSIPGWVDLFGKDPPPGWTCAPLEDWDFDSQSTDSQPISADQPATSHTSPDEEFREDLTEPVDDQDHRAKTHPGIPVAAVSAQQSEARTGSRSARAAPTRTPRGWCSPVDMLIPRGASLYCSRYRRPYGLPNARASPAHRAAHPVVLPLLVTWFL